MSAISFSRRDALRLSGGVPGSVTLTSGTAGAAACDPLIPPPGLTQQNMLFKSLPLFRHGEPLAPDEMRVSFMGTSSLERKTQMDTSVYVELGCGDSFVFDSGMGCQVNCTAMQVPSSKMVVAERPMRSRTRWCRKSFAMGRVLAWVTVVLASLITGCASLPSQEGRSATSALTDTAGTRLGRAVASEVAANPGKTGVHALLVPRDAFAARVLLAAAADRSLDVQYYIWHGDQTGTLLFEALWRTAERGVRVRLLLDDNGTAGLDETIAALDAHPNLEVRLYNPVVHRDARGLDFLTDFSRVNRRMHNKSFTADNQVSIVGGRNVGNEYFGVGNEVLFGDLDVLAVGSAVQEVSQEFDLYWNSESAYPAAGLVGTAGPDAPDRLEAGFAAVRADPESIVYVEAVRKAPFIRQLLAGRPEFEWATARVVHDDPAKTLASTARADVLLMPDLRRTMGSPQSELDLVSPYFVPGTEGTAAVAALARRGVKVRIITNSLAASDVAAVHAGYAKRREELLRAGVQLYEFKPSASREAREEQWKLGASSSAALHAKTFAVDRSRIFIGSFNFDPRSALLNTEMGIVIDSPMLAKRLAAFFDTVVPFAAYEVRLTTDGQSLEWTEQSPSGEKRYDIEPGTSWLLRTGIGILSILPIDWLL